MDATQVLDDFDDEELSNSVSKKTVAFLKVQAVGEFPQTLFPVYEGENIIGRHENCDITIPLQAVSKKHACIDVHGKNHLICDYNSRNKTRRNQMSLKPQAFYELVNEVELMFGDVKCQYLLAKAEDLIERDNISDSGSETTFESMMPVSKDDDEEPKNEEKLNSSVGKITESVNEDVNQPTQEYSYINPDEKSSAVFCPETDDEGDNDDDDETEDETEDEKDKHVEGSSFSEDKTLACSAGGTENDSTLEATLPKTLEPDTIPATPFTQSDDFQPLLKRSVDVKVDATRRTSAGNTLAFGLSTLESPNSTRESMDANESEGGRTECLGETSASISEVKDKLSSKEDKGQETPNNKDKRLQETVQKQDELFDDLLATQLYEPMEIPESPEFLGHENDVSEDSRKDDKTALENETPEGKTSEGKISESEISEDKTSECKTSETRIPDDMMETQAYGLDTSLENEDDDMATQAYGLTIDGESADTGYELSATLAYDVEDDINVPLPTVQNSSVLKVPGVLNTQELSGEKLGVDGDSGSGNDEQKNNALFDEMAIQPTQNYIDYQAKDGEETSASSDVYLPSFSSFMGVKSDSDTDFMSSKKKKDLKSAPQSSTPVNKKSSIIIEGQNSLSTEKHCYVECPGGNEESSQNEEYRKESSNTKKRSVKKRSKSTATRTEIKDNSNDNASRLHDESTKVDSATSSTKDTEEQQETTVVKRGKGRAVRGRKTAASTRKSRAKKVEDDEEGINNNMVDENKEAGKESIGIRRSARKRKISEDTAKEEMKHGREDSSKPVVTVSKKNTRSARERKSSENSSKSEAKEEMKENRENILSENEQDKSDIGTDSDVFKLQISAVDSPETNDFIPTKKTKRPALQRGKKRKTEILESDNESETERIVRGITEQKETTGVPTKSLKKRGGRKSKDNEGTVSVVQEEAKEKNDKNELIITKKKRVRNSQSVSEIGDTEDVHKDEVEKDNITSIEHKNHTNQSKNSSVKSTKQERAKKRQDLPELDNEESISEDVLKKDNVHEDKNKETQQKDLMGKSGESLNQEIPDAMTPVINIRMERKGKKGKQTGRKTSQKSQNDIFSQQQEVQDKNEVIELISNMDKTEDIKEAKTPAKRRAGKRKSSENSDENKQRMKGSAKKRRKNTTTKAEVNEEQLSRDSLLDDAKFDSEELTPKSLARSSSRISNSSSSSSNTSRSVKRGKKQEEANEDCSDHSSNVKIIFTGLKDDVVLKATKIVKALGGKVVDRLEDSTHIITDKVRRTVKLLCAVSRGIPVVDMKWLDASKKSKSFVDSNNFILQDKEAEKKFGFCMKRSLEVAQTSGLLQGYRLHVTTHVRPPPEEMKEIIRSAKGEVVNKMSRDCDVTVLSCDEDKKLCEKANVEKVYTAELLLTGILRQELDLEQHRLTLGSTSDVNTSQAKSKGRRKR